MVLVHRNIKRYRDATRYETELFDIFLNQRRYINPSDMPGLSFCFCADSGLSTKTQLNSDILEVISPILYDHLYKFAIKYHDEITIFRKYSTDEFKKKWVQDQVNARRSISEFNEKFLEIKQRGEKPFEVIPLVPYRVFMATFLKPPVFPHWFPEDLRIFYG